MVENRKLEIPVESVHAYVKIHVEREQLGT